MSMQGDVALLNDSVAQDLLTSNIPASLAYVWTDGTPRVVPIWFHWNGSEIVCGTPPDSPKLKAIQDGSKISLSIDGRTWPYKVLLVRGTVRVELIDDGVSPEYADSAVRYFGEEAGKGWVDQMRGMADQMANIVITPEWVGILDFETRFPSAVEALMAGGE